jgi:mannosylglycoprotein endo-beta-mannosidase
MSGMKINYDKSEVFTVGLEEAKQQIVVAALNCKLGSFPMKYLGLPVSDCKISEAQLKYVSDKIEKRLDTWQCEYLSSGGKSTLIDSCLSSIPLYTMGVYYLYEGNF